MIRHLFGENVQVYEVYGNSERKILKTVRKLIKDIGSERPYDPTLFSIDFQLDDTENLFGRVFLSVA